MECGVSCPWPIEKILYFKTIQNILMTCWLSGERLLPFGLLVYFFPPIQICFRLNKKNFFSNFYFYFFLSNLNVLRKKISKPSIKKNKALLMSEKREITYFAKEGNLLYVYLENKHQFWWKNNGRIVSLPEKMNIFRSYKILLSRVEVEPL